MSVRRLKGVALPRVRAQPKLAIRAARDVKPVNLIRCDEALMTKPKPKINPFVMAACVGAGFSIGCDVIRLRTDEWDEEILFRACKWALIAGAFPVSIPVMGLYQLASDSTSGAGPY